MFVPILDLVAGAMVRGKIRDRQNIEGNFVKDLLVWFCCPLCALVQEAQEVQHMGGAQAIVRE